MPLRTAEQYREGLRDGRVVYYRGQRVEDVTTHEQLSIGVRHTSLDYEIAEDTEHRDLFTWTDEAGQVHSRYYKHPAHTQDLLNRREMIETSTRLADSTVLLIKEIGTDALFALDLVSRFVDEKAGTDYHDRVSAFHAHARDHDLSLAVAQTDVKGDRALLPSEQTHPDYYVRIVEEREDGIVVRGCKAHTTNTPMVDEIIVLPTRAIGEQDAAYAVAFAIPVNTPGVKLLASPFGTAERHSGFHFPVSSQHHLVDTLTIFDDVFIPLERVFLSGEWQAAGFLANTFVEFHRFTAVSYKPPLCDLFIGAAALLADYNGIPKVSHVREKLTKLITWTETVRGLSRAAAHDCRITDSGLAVPNVLLTNLAKYAFANQYHEAIQWVQDIAGGLVVTGPDELDMASDELRPYIDQYLGGANVDAETRLKAMNLVRDLTASEFGGYNQLLAIHAEGSLEAQKITVFRDYDLERCKDLAAAAIGVTR
ncbi:MAG: 4-hydroxyphenylacetate 3-hydroxylase N-terminal domain-containing protein [Candidatus Latescibacterota bacterium]|nr:4-hydroxyphenylacetate 3-hydroxylase N-terminal domain-containing protein [Candidatus Latescibacterota bacterium]